MGRVNREIVDDIIDAGGRKHGAPWGVIRHYSNDPMGDLILALIADRAVRIDVAEAIIDELPTMPPRIKQALRLVLESLPPRWGSGNDVTITAIAVDNARERMLQSAPG